MVKVLKPVLTRAAGVPMPKDSVFDAVERLHADLTEVRDLLTGPEAPVRLVLTPESVVVAEARRSLTTLSLYGYRVDGVVANRIFPAADADPWRRQWVVAQTAILAEVESRSPPLPIWRSPYRPREPVGLDELADFATGCTATTTRSRHRRRTPDDVRRSGSTGRAARGPAVRRPRRRRARPARRRAGRDVGSYRRLLALPAGAGPAKVAGARIEEGALRVRFEERTS